MGRSSTLQCSRAVPFAAVPGAVFNPCGERFIATDLARGPWDAEAQHGGAPAALIVRALERFGASGLRLARVTYELLRPVPLGELEVRVQQVRPGRRVEVLEASLHTADGTDVVRARGLKLRPADLAAGSSCSDRPAPPEQGHPSDFDRPEGLGFAKDAMEIRFVAGSFYTPGPATAWFRLSCELVAGETPSPLQRLAAAADFPNGISAVLPWDEYVFINPELTIYIEREPVGEWICLEADTRVCEGGHGLAQAVLYDMQGRVGRSLQALLVSPRQAAT